MKKIILLFIQTAIGIILLFLFVTTNDISHIAFSLSQISISATCFAMSIVLASLLVRGVRFRILLSPLKRISLIDSSTSTLASTLINYLIPIHIGEFARAWFVKKKYGLSLVSGTTVSVVDKLFDIAGAFLLLVLIAPFIEHYSLFTFVSLFQMIFIILFSLFLYLLAFKPKFCLTIVSHALFFLPGTMKTPLLHVCETIIHGFSVLKMNPVVFGATLFLSLFAVLLNAISFYLLFYILGFTNIPLLLVVLGYIMLFLGFIVPAGPGYVGNIELFGLFIFTNILGIPRTQVVPTIILYHVTITIVLALSGFLSLILLHVNLKHIYRKIIIRTS